jgi:hypothetical protein
MLKHLKQRSGSLREMDCVLSSHHSGRRLKDLSSNYLGGNSWLLNGEAVGTLITMNPYPCDWWQPLHAAVSLPNAVANFPLSFDLIAASI